MAQDPGFDVRASHRHFSADCFNKAWELIERPSRTPEEDELMIHLNQTSIWHWTQRDDCSSRNMSIGYWQASRIYAILGRSEEARHYGRLCLEYSRQEPPFFLAYAYEALARAEYSAGDEEAGRDYLAEAFQLANSVDDAEEKSLLLSDLRTIK